MKSYLGKHDRALSTIGALIALVIAIIYLKVIPDEASTATGIQKTILIYGHSLCWILLSGASIVWAIIKNHKLSKFLACAALATYIIFVGTLLTTKFL